MHSDVRQLKIFKSGFQSEKYYAGAEEILCRGRERRKFETCMKYPSLWNHASDNKPRRYASLKPWVTCKRTQIAVIFMYNTFVAQIHLFRFPSMSSQVKIVECQVGKREVLPGFPCITWNTAAECIKQTLCNSEFEICSELGGVQCINTLQLGWLGPLPSLQLALYWKLEKIGQARQGIIAFLLSHFCARHAASFLEISRNLLISPGTIRGVWSGSSLES